MMDNLNIAVYRTDWLDEDGMKLRDLQQAEIRASFTAEPGVPPSADDVPIFLVMKSSGVPIACGGLRPLSECAVPTAELKRMYVLPPLRGRAIGAADRLMLELESHARKDGFTVLRLETAIAMIHARKFYERHGYQEIPLYGHYVGTMTSVCYEKTLDPESSP